MFENNNQKPRTKSFWSKPEGVGTMMLGGLAIVGMFFFGGTILTAIAGIVGTTVGLIISGSIVAILAIALSDKDFRTTIKYMVKGWTRRFGSLIVQTNPIKILNSYVDDLNKNIENIKKNRDNLVRQMGKLQYQINKHTEDIDRLYRLASQAKQQGKNDVAATNAGEATDRANLLKKYKALYDRMSFFVEILTKMEGYASRMANRISSKVKLKEEEYAMIKSSKGAMSSAWAVIKGGTSEKRLFDQAWDFVNEETEIRVKEMESMLHGMQDFMDSVDLEDAANMEKGMESLEKWEKQMQKSFEQDFSYLDLADNPSKIEEIISSENANLSIGKQREKVKVSTGSDASKGAKYF